MNHNKRWQKHYDALVTYYERYGDALVPSGHIEFLSSGEELNLGNWVSYMRTRYKQGCLSDHRINLLEEVPTWSWGPIRPGPKSRDFVVKRNAEILSKYNNGSSLSGIAKEFGLSRQRIHQIVKETV
tara:strand:- start:1095 stop:1475 length:381 start_codon:yes stop_codon:yes gene_type:complete